MSEVKKDDIFRGFGIEIRLKKPDDFLKIKETLTRIGVAAKKENILYQSCHILHKQGRYSILHFKELFGLDGKSHNLTEEDIGRRNTIVNLLWEWGLVEMIDPGEGKVLAPMNQIKIIAFKDKGDWTLTPKYQIGKKISKAEVK